MAKLGPDNNSTAYIYTYIYVYIYIYILSLSACVPLEQPATIQRPPAHTMGSQRHINEAYPTQCYMMMFLAFAEMVPLLGVSMPSLAIELKTKAQQGARRTRPLFADMPTRGSC